MQYMLLIYDNEASSKGAPPEAREKMFADYRGFTSSLIQSGHMKAGDALQPTSTATTVRVRDGKTLSTDGPFAETKEQLGGYYVLNCQDLDEAIAWAAKVPHAQYGSVEIRPLWSEGAG